MSGLALFTGCLSVFLIGCGPPTDGRQPVDRVVYERRLSSVCDLAYLVDASVFTEEHLISLSRQILRKEAERNHLIRLTFASSERWVTLALPRGTYSYQNPRRYSEEAKTSQIAQMVYRDGSAVLRTKLGSQVLTRELLGTGDPLTLRFGKATASLSSFTLLSAETIVFYLEADPLPSPEQWNVLYRELKRSVGILRVDARIRPDTQFGESGGWMFDVFQFPYPDISLEEYDKRRYLGCSQSASDAAPIKSDGFECKYSTAGFGRPLKVD